LYTDARKKARETSIKARETSIYCLLTNSRSTTILAIHPRGVWYKTKHGREQYLGKRGIGRYSASE
jgi:hypothetical protein